MRIEPKRETIAALQPTTSTDDTDSFTDALASAQGSFSETPSIADDAANADKAPPLAQRWGQYGLGATKAGFGTPNPDLYADAPVGPNAAASPLNPGGVTTTPSFVVSGYTGRGTPVPPGFYNIAYYNLYLQQGGTPLEGFPQMEDGSTLSATYGTFGDGATRATSFLTGHVDNSTDTPDAAAGADTAAAASAANALINAAAAAASPAPAAAAAPAAASTDAATKIAAVSHATTSTLAGAAGKPAATTDPSPQATTTASGADLLRTELAALLGDLLRSA